MRLYFQYLSVQIRSEMQYKLSFFFTVLGQFIVSFGSFLSIWIMMERFHTVDGFTLPEVLLCFGTILMSFSIAEAVFRGFDNFPRLIGDGSFDRMMVRPRNLILRVLGSVFELSRVGRLLQAILTFAYAIPKSDVIWTWDKILTLIGMLISGTAVFSGLFLMYAAFSFFTLEGLEGFNIFTYGTREFGQYPISIYGRGILRFMTYIIPVALFQYYPLLYILGRTEHIWYAFLPLVSLLFLIPCALFWKIGVRHYRSAGS